MTLPPFGHILSCRCCAEPPSSGPSLGVVGVTARCETGCGAGTIVITERSGRVKTETYTGDPTDPSASCDVEVRYAGSYTVTDVTTAGASTGSTDCSGSGTLVESVTFRENDGVAISVWSGGGSFTRGEGEDTETSSYTVSANGSFNYTTDFEFGCFNSETTSTRSPAEALEQTLVSTRNAAECMLEFPVYPEFTTAGDPPPILLPGQTRDNRAAARNWSAAEPPTFQNSHVTREEGRIKNDTKIKWRVEHLPTPTCYLKVWLHKILTPFGQPSEEPEEVTYVWRGSGNPCISNPQLGWQDDSNMIYGASTEILPPEANGAVSINIIKYSFVEGYEPDISESDNRQPSGFADPLWEPNAP